MGLELRKALCNVPLTIVQDVFDNGGCIVKPDFCGDTSNVPENVLESLKEAFKILSRTDLEESGVALREAEDHVPAENTHRSQCTRLRQNRIEQFLRDG